MDHTTSEPYMERLLEVFGENPNNTDIKLKLFDIFINISDEFKYPGIEKDINLTNKDNVFSSDQLLRAYLSDVSERLGICLKLIKLNRNTLEKLNIQAFVPGESLVEGPATYYEIEDLYFDGALFSVKLEDFQDQPQVEWDLLDEVLQEDLMYTFADNERITESLDFEFDWSEIISPTCRV